MEDVNQVAAQQEEKEQRSVTDYFVILTAQAPGRRAGETDVQTFQGTVSAGTGTTARDLYDHAWTHFVPDYMQNQGVVIFYSATPNELPAKP